MKIQRKVNRNKLKQSQKNNKINKNWRIYQINKYGIKKWCDMYNKSKNIKSNADKITPKTAYYV